MKNSIKRAQSQACLGFAERKNFRPMAKQLKKLTMTLALLIMAVGGAWAGEEPQLLTTINASSSFLTGSQTFDDIATVTFGGAGTVAFNDKNGWVQDEYQKESTVTVTAVDGYTITSIKIYSADSNTNYNNATISTSPFTAYLNNWGATYVTTGTGGAGAYIGDELVRIEVYGYQSEPEPTIDVTPVTGETNKWTFTMPDADVELTPIYAPELTAAFVAGNANTIQSGKATVTVTEKDGTTAYTGATLGTDGKLTPLYEGQTVTLTAAAGYKFKSVSATKDNGLKTITISGIELTYANGDTWTLVYMRNLGKMVIVDVQPPYIASPSNHDLILKKDGVNVGLDDVIDPTANYAFTSE